MRVLVTGAYGFIGKNLCEYLATSSTVDLLKFGRQDSTDKLRSYIRDADFIFHLAGVNRPHSDDEFIIGNLGLTETILSELEASNLRTPVLVSSSTQAELDNAYGKSKCAAEQAVFNYGKTSGSPVYVYRLPGVFGKWCKPNYNSVVATFCHNIANSQPIEISSPDHIVTLAYVDDVVHEFASKLTESKNMNTQSPLSISTTFNITLAELVRKIKEIHESRLTLVTPDLSDKLNRYLLATYTSYLKTDGFSYNLTKNSDERGWLAEFIKSPHFGQVFISKTKPGISRGDHWHNTKVEKFLVIQGSGQIIFRHKIDHHEVIRYDVSGDDLKVLDIPSGYIHAIKNTGNSDMITIFWASEIFNKDEPDTFYEKVETNK